MMRFAVCTGRAIKRKKLHMKEAFCYPEVWPDKQSRIVNQSQSGAENFQHRTTFGLLMPLVALRVSTTNCASPTIFR